MSTEIEDLSTHKKFNDVEKYIIPENMDTYYEAVKDLYNYVQDLNDSNTKIVKLKKSVNKYFSKLTRKYNKIKISKRLMVYVYKQMIQNGLMKYNDDFMTLLRHRPIRTNSGVSSFAIMLSPYPEYYDPKQNKIIRQNFSCKHNCKFCPTIPNYPKSYVPGEPGVDRGKQNDWLPDKQLDARLECLDSGGHKVAKIELILEGGTYTNFPKPYLIDFHTKLFYTANTWGQIQKREMYDIDAEMYINRSANVRIIGICIETRADCFSDPNDKLEWLKFMRKIGITRIQIGAQHTDDFVLKKSARGHDYQASYDAAKFLQDNCFKTVGQFMFDLPYSTPDKDKKMIDKVINDGVWDSVKWYPFAVLEDTEYMKEIQSGKIELYSQIIPHAVFDVMKYAFTIISFNIRVERAQRDIPSYHIHYGNDVSNIRQLVENRLKKEKVFVKDIRSREIGRNEEYIGSKQTYFIDKHEVAGGINYFIECASTDRKACFGFLRLRITEDSFFDELKNKGLIREVHVYNHVKGFGKQKSSSTQHIGIGKKLIKIAEKISKKHSKKGIAVISGEGVIDYYKSQGYEEGQYYIIKNFDTIDNRFIILYILTYILIIMFCMFITSYEQVCVFLTYVL